MTQPVRVLVIEDNAVDAMVVTRYISSMGWVPVRAESLGEAMNLVEHEGATAFDVVLVDLTLSDASGFEAVDYVATALPHSACVVSTAEDQFEVAEEAMTRGATDYLVKGEMTVRGVQRALSYALNSKRLLRAAENAELNLRQVLSASTDAILVVDLSHRVLFHNAPARVFYDDITRSSPHGDKLALEVRASEELATTLVRADGKRASVMVRGRRMSWDERSAVAVVIQDITAEQEVQRLQEELQGTKGLAGLEDWHDVKNHMSVAAHELHRLEEVVPGDTELSASFDAVVANVERTLETANRHKFPSKTRRQRVDINALVKTERALLAASVPPNADLRLRLHPELALVHGDPWRLQQVIHNVVHNAVKAVRRQPREAHEITVETSMVGPDTVRVTVKDTGSGIEAGKTLDDLTKGSSEDGWGVGLRGVLKSVEDHDGRIHFESEQGIGTAFYVELPAADQVRARSGRPVLVVEDQPEVAESILRGLREFYEVQAVGNGAEALQVLREERGWHAILSDLQMPELDGRGLHEALTAQHPELVSRLVFMTGDDPAGWVADTGRPVLYKAFRVEDAVDAIEQVAPPEG